MSIVSISIQEGKYVVLNNFIQAMSPFASAKNAVRQAKMFAEKTPNSKLSISKKILTAAE
jgi:hypothetical protein